MGCFASTAPRHDDVGTMLSCDRELEAMVEGRGADATEAAATPTCNSCSMSDVQPVVTVDPVVLLGQTLRAHDQTTTYYKAVLPGQSHLLEYFVSGYGCPFATRTTWRVGETQTLPDTLPDGRHSPLQMSKYGFHACEQLAAVILLGSRCAWYRYKLGECVVLKVRLHGPVIFDGVTAVALGCTPIEIVPHDVVRAAVLGKVCLRRSAGLGIGDRGIHEQHFQGGVLHRDHGLPAVTYGPVCKHWYTHGVLTRILFDGVESHYDGSGKLHREDGLPAVTTRFSQEYWVHGSKQQ